MLDARGNFIGLAPTSWRVVTLDDSVPVSDAGLAAIARAGILAAAFTNRNATRQLAAIADRRTRPAARTHIA